MVEEAGPSSNGSVFQFDVFLSFRGTDARQGFISHLYKELNRFGVITFIDSEELQKGERISQLFHYMESSQIFIPILSKNYAQSKWCLLEAAKMVEIAEGAQQKMRPIIPVFYHVDPSDVKDDGGLYKSAIVELQKEGGLEGVNVQECIDALKTIGRISGFPFKKGTENEAELISCVRRDVEKLLGRVRFAVQPIGIDSQIDKVIKMLEAQVNGVCMVGICGMGGIGKTTIAKAIYDKLPFSEFDGRIFIEDMRELASDRKGHISVQEMLICDVLKIGSVSIRTVEDGWNIIKQKIGGKRVLLILDNVDKVDQLKPLLGDYICHKPDDLVGGGSKIVVTTRDKAVLLRYKMKEHQIYYPEELKDPWSLKLFYKHAFMHEPPSFELLHLAKEVAGIVGGLPLVLVTIGSVFAGLLTREEWEGELKKIRKNRGAHILEKLKWSYDGLDNDQKCVFLDIACFLVGAKKKRATYLWDDRSHENAIRVLKERNLISIDDEDRFRMHDLIQEMGRSIGSGEGNIDPYINIRLCFKNEQSIMLEDFQEKGKVEGIVLNVEEQCTETSLTMKVFVDMPKLRLLQLNFVNFLKPKIGHFPKRLKWLQWRGCILESVTFDNTSFENLVVLDLSQSRIYRLTLKNKGKTFEHLEELSASGSKTSREDETFSFMVPLGSPSSPLLLQQLQCYGDGSKSGILSNIYVKVSVKEMEDNLVIYETIFSGYRDIDNEIDWKYGWCYTVSFSEYDDINIFPNLYRPCSICVSTANNFPLIKVDILLRSACRWSKNYSKVIPVGENVTNSRRISVEQNQSLPSMLSAEYSTFEFDVLFRYVKEDIDTKFINNLYKALQQHGIRIFKDEDVASKGGECLLTYIERSAICIPIFSKGFSQSKSHLNSVAKMVNSRKFIIPVYFQVHPLDIRDQKGEFGTYFSCDENEDQREIVEDWRKTLEVVVRRCHHQFSYDTNRFIPICLLPLRIVPHIL
ncbi:disease resistance protein L6-like [Nymphaea colorata]|nr:disease resistance protein L6-like [Nymphaea colorata]